MARGSDASLAGAVHLADVALAVLDDRPEPAASSSASSFERTSTSAKLTIVSLDSAYGPSVNVTLPPLAVTWVPFMARPPVARSTPACVSSSMNFAMSA